MEDVLLKLLRDSYDLQEEKPKASSLWHLQQLRALIKTEQIKLEQLKAKTTVEETPKKYKLWDGIEGELIDMESPKEAKQFMLDNYTEGSTAHPDIYDLNLMEVIELPHPLEDQLKD